MGQITTHILDTSQGIPAKDIPLNLSVLNDDQWLPISAGITNHDGRVEKLLPAEQVLRAGTYRLRFETAEYYNQQKKAVFYPWVDVVFALDNKAQHYHIPLLLSPFGYSTYRGS